MAIPAKSTLLSDLVRKRCVQRGVSLSEVATRAGITRAYLHRLLKGGVSNPGVQTLQKLAVACEIPTMALLQTLIDTPSPMKGTARRHEGLADPEDAMVFLGDVTIPDHSVMVPGEKFCKTWAVQNVGERVWSGRRLARIDKPVDAAPSVGQLLTHESTQIESLGNQVEVPTTLPGQMVELSVDMRAPLGSCTVSSAWRMVAADGAPCFGRECHLYTVITVVGW